MIRKAQFLVAITVLARLRLQGNRAYAGCPALFSTVHSYHMKKPLLVSYA
jgi:hypothetical protein